MTEYYIVDLRPEFSGRYITFWRPDNAGYAYPLPWAGRYSQATVDEAGSYYHGSKDHRTRVDRFPVPCEIVERFGVAPAPGAIDGDVGPVVPRTEEIRKALKAAKYRPASLRAKEAA